MPVTICFEDGLSSHINPQRVVQQGGAGATHTFSRGFHHPAARTAQASPEAVNKFYADNRRFPATAYEP